MACSVILDESRLRSTELRHHINDTRIKLRGISKRLRLKLLKVLVAGSNKLFEIAIIQAVLVITVHPLESKDLSVAFVLIHVGLNMEVGISRIRSIRRILVCAEESARHTRHRRIDLCGTSISVL